MYLSDPILHHLKAIEALASSGVVHPRLWGCLYKMSSNLLYMGRGEFSYDRYVVLLQTATCKSTGAAKLGVKTRMYHTAENAKTVFMHFAAIMLYGHRSLCVHGQIGHYRT